MQSFQKSLFLKCFLVMTILSFTGCLKTRAQIKDDQSSEEAPRQTNAPTPVQAGPAGSRYVIDEMKSEIARLSGRIEDLERENQNKDTNKSKEDIKRLENKITELEQTQTTLLEALKKLQEQPQPTAAEPKDLLEKGTSQFESNNYEGAIETLSQYLKVGKGKGVEEATFYRAESYYNTKQYKKAIVDYSKFPEKYLKSKHMAPALYKIALSFEALGMKEDAKGFYQELVEKYPKSTEAKKAKSKLK